MKKNPRQIWKKATEIIPGGNGLLSKRPDRFLPGGWPIYYSRAKGSHIWDLNNNKYIDMSLMGIGTSVLGYSNSYVDNFVKKKIDLGVNTTLNSIEEYQLAKEILKIDKFADQVKFARGGGEAMSLAVRIARTKSKKSKVLFCGYHGWHDWYIAANLANIKNLNNHLLKNLTPAGVPSNLKNSSEPLKINDIHELIRKTKKKNIAAIIVEPARNDYLKKEFILELNKVCRDNNIILIIDEITLGWRECLGGVYRKIGLKPDMVVYGKAMGNGYAISAVVGKKKIMNAAQNTFVSSVAWTEKVGFAAGLAVINFHKKKNIFSKNRKIGKLIKEGLLRIAKKHNLEIEISTLDTVVNFNFKRNNDYLSTIFTELMLKKKFLATNLIYVSYSHTLDIVEKYFKAVDWSFEKISKSIKLKKDILKSKIRNYNYK